MQSNHGTTVIANARNLLTMAENAQDHIGLVTNGFLGIRGEKIVAVGTEKAVYEALGGPPEQVIDASGMTVLPGFVDAHTHVVFGGTRVAEYAASMTPEGYERFKSSGALKGLEATIRMTREADRENLKAQAKKRILDMLEHGTTTVESKSGYGLDIATELKQLMVNRELDEELPVDIVSTFLGAHGWPPEMTKEDYLHHLLEEMMPRIAATGLAEFCDIWCDEGHFSREESELVLSKGRALGMEPKIHTGAYSYIGGGDLAAEMKMVSTEHLNYTPPKTLKKLAEAGVPGVLLPGTDFSVRHPMPVKGRDLIDAGMTVALGTNCCPGAWITSMQLVMTLICRNHGLTVEEALRAATLGSARAIRRDSDRGSLEVGKLADIQIWDTPHYEDVIYHLGENQVTMVFKRGLMVIDRKKTQE
ncbi:MAG: imidazolonepropionase [delta proteobacterium ML8_F1]|nr:MAG: imidazolonepropionase [delta proteobacterium ML8_F1]